MDVAFVLLLALLLVAAYTDVRYGKIFNWTTYSGVLLAWAVNAVGLIWQSDQWQTVIGWLNADNPLWESFLGFLACGAAMVICFVFFGIGGGDVKLLAMVGAFLGLYDGILALLWSMVLGGAMGLVVLIWKVGAWTLVRETLARAWLVVRFRPWEPLREEQRKALNMRLFLAPTATPAVLIVKFRLLDGIL